jgi:hypothetical protein
MGMQGKPQEDSVHETRAACVDTQADVVHVQLDVPRDVWTRLTRWAVEHQIGETEAVIQIIEHQLAAPENTHPTGFYADLISQHMGDELESGPRLIDIQVDESVAKAIRHELEKDYETADPVELIERMRNRE